MQYSDTKMAASEIGGEDRVISVTSDVIEGEVVGGAVGMLPQASGGKEGREGMEALGDSCLEGCDL
jgi:hypothetical protein